MAQEVRNFAPTIPAGTLITAPATVALTFPQREVQAIRWRVPHGPMGNMGFGLALSGQVIIPWGAGQWIVADDESDTVPLAGYPNSGAWQLIGYNSGAYPHTVYVTFYLVPVGASLGSSPTGPLVIPSPGAVG